MPNETRVNLKHLLEDLRDAYTVPLGEIIVTELVANALDSGAHEIRLTTDPAARAFCCTDNGGGMNRAALKSYHNIAASTKERGEGIGFAGVGAKLSLLVAEKVITETRGPRGSRSAAEWHLSTPYRAPWKFVPSAGAIEQGRGTAVRIVLKKDDDPLLDPETIIKTIRRSFYPLICESEALKKIYKGLYKKPISFFVNGVPVASETLTADMREFFVRIGSARAKPIGAGLLQKARMDKNFWQKIVGADPARPNESGLRIATYGKVIKGGWEWLGLPVRQQELLTGVVEVLELAQILTTNKADFLTDAVALKRYYRIRKAIQHALMPILRELGAVDEKTDGGQKTPAAMQRLAHDLEGALSLMAPTFPELDALVGEHWKRMRASEGEKGKRKKKEKAMEHVAAETEEKEKNEKGDKKEREQNASLTTDPKGTRTKREKQPALTVEFADFTEKHEKDLLGKLVGETIVVNTAHPAWQRAGTLGQEPYHVILTVALTLAEYLQPTEGAGNFVSAFLKAWSKATEKSGKLL